MPATPPGPEEPEGPGLSACIAVSETRTLRPAPALRGGPCPRHCLSSAAQSPLPAETSLRC